MTKTKDEVAEALSHLIKEIADPEGLRIDRIRCDEGCEFSGRFEVLASNLGVKIETSAPYVPQSNAVAERGFGTVIGMTRSMMMGVHRTCRVDCGEKLRSY